VKISTPVKKIITVSLILMIVLLSSQQMIQEDLQYFDEEQIVNETYGYCDTPYATSSSTTTQSSSVETLMQNEGISSSLIPSMNIGDYVYKLTLSGGGGDASKSELGVCFDSNIPRDSIVKGTSDSDEIWRTKIGSESSSMLEFNDLGWVEDTQSPTASSVYVTLDSKWGTNKDTYINWWLVFDQSIDFRYDDPGTENFGSIVVDEYIISNSGSSGTNQESDDHGEITYYDVGLSNLDSIVEFTYGTTDLLGAEMEIAYSLQGSSDVLCTAPISQPNLVILVDDAQCINGEYTFLQYSVWGKLRGIKQQRSLYEFSSDMTESLLYTFSSDVTGVVNPSSYPWILCVSTTDGKIHLLDTTKEGVLVESITPSQSAFATSLTTDLYGFWTGSFWVGFSDGSLLEISLQHDETEEDYWFGSFDQPTSIANSAILDIASMSLAGKVNSEFSDLMVMDENTVYGLKSSNYEEVWRISESANRFTSLSNSLVCTLFSANSVGDIVEYGTCDPTENNHFNTTSAFSISDELNENDCASSNAVDCPSVLSVDEYSGSFIASAGSTFVVVKRDIDSSNPLAGEPEFYDWVMQMPNHSWKSDVLCQENQVLCFAKTVSSAFMDDKITYIDQTITVSGSNIVSYDTVKGVIRDNSGALVEKVPLTCTSYGTDVGCSADITFETTEVKQKILDETFEILHDGAEEYFISQLEEPATHLFAEIAIPILCTVVAGISAGASGGLAAIPVGAGCVKALWVLYKAVKSISFLMTLVSYYNIIDEGLGNYENSLFPNRYLTEIEVDGVVYDIDDTRLNRLNDISVDELVSFGNKDKLEYLGFSPIGFHAMDGDEVLSDSGDLFQVTGDSSLEMLLWVDASWGDHVLVEGTDDGTYSMIGIFNDGDASDASADDETPYFGNAFLVVIDEKTEPASQDYYDVSKSNWQVEADSPYQFASNQDCPNGSSCDGGDVDEDSSVFTIILLVILILGGLGLVVYNQRSRFKSNGELIGSRTQSGFIPTGRMMVPSQRTGSHMPLPTNQVPQYANPVPQPGNQVPQYSNQVPQPTNPVPQPAIMAPQPRPSTNAQGVIGDDGYEWITFPPNTQAYYYRSPGSRDWVKFEN